MERRVNKLVDEYTTAFKTSILNKAKDLSLDDNANVRELLQYIYDYDKLVLDKVDFVKQKRSSNFIPSVERCIAKRANNEQCSRRKKEGCNYCGTHEKGVPNGSVVKTDTCSTASLTHKVEVWSEEILGIIYYIDTNENVYEAEDILRKVSNPKIIGSYRKEDKVLTLF
jgi:hypothetical protein